MFNLKILAIIAVLYFIIQVIVSFNKAKEAPYNQQDDNLYQGFLIHVGGHPTIKNGITMQLTIQPEAMYLVGNKQEHKININDIIACEIKNEIQIVRHPTVARMLALGVFAFALPKKKIDTTLYMVLSYKTPVATFDCIFKQSKLNKNIYEIPNIIAKLQAS